MNHFEEKTNKDQVVSDLWNSPSCVKSIHVFLYFIIVLDITSFQNADAGIKKEGSDKIINSSTASISLEQSNHSWL